MRDRNAALRACAAATAGALAGGLLMYLWGARDPAGVSSVLLSVPAIGPGMLEKVRGSLASNGALALFVGPVTGTPYKIYAAESGAAGLSLAVFLAVSVPARGLRFLLLTLAAGAASRGPFARLPLSRRRALVGGLWAVFYAVYFAVK